MTPRVLHLLGPMAHHVAPFIERLGAPATTTPPLAPDASQLYCHSRALGNPILMGRDLLDGQSRAPEGRLACWGVEADEVNSLAAMYLHNVREAFPSAEAGVGVLGLLDILRTFGYTAELTPAVLFPPHTDPDPTPLWPTERIRHTTGIPGSLLASAHRDAQALIHHAKHVFWQMHPDLRDDWLMRGESRQLLGALVQRGYPLRAMIWHRGADTTAAVRARFAAEEDPQLRLEYLRGLVFWGTPDELPAAHALLAGNALRNTEFDLGKLPRALAALLHENPTRRRQMDDEGWVSIIRLLERDPAFWVVFAASATPHGQAETLRKTADIYLSSLALPMNPESLGPERTAVRAYVARMGGQGRSPSRPVDPGHHLPDGEYLAKHDDPVEGLGKLSAAARGVPGRMWRGEEAAAITTIVSAWGRRASSGADLAVADWLQSFRGPVTLLAHVANGVLRWPTLSPATVVGINRAAAMSKSVTKITSAELIKRIPTEQIPPEWVAMAAEAANTTALGSTARRR